MADCLDTRMDKETEAVVRSLHAAGHSVHIGRCIDCNKNHYYLVKKDKVTMTPIDIEAIVADERMPTRRNLDPTFAKVDTLNDAQTKSSSNISATIPVKGSGFSMSDAEFEECWSAYEDVLRKEEEDYQDRMSLVHEEMMREEEETYQLMMSLL